VTKAKESKKTTTLHAKPNRELWQTTHGGGEKVRRQQAKPIKLKKKKRERCETKLTRAGFWEGSREIQGKEKGGVV